MESGSKFRNIKYLFVGIHPLTKLFLLLVGMLSIFFIVTFLGMLLAIPIFNLSLNGVNMLIKNNLENAETGFIKFFQSIQSIGFFVIPGILFWYLFFDDTKPAVQYPKKINALAGILIFLTIISMVPLISTLVTWNAEIQFPSGMAEFEATLQKLENDAAVLTERILAGSSFQHFLINLLIIAILPAIGEEFIFRGVLQKILVDWTKNSLVAILIASIIFSAFHMQFYGFIPRLLLGIYFGYIFYWSKSIWFAVWAHFLNNALAVSLHFLSLKNISLFPAYFGEESISIVSFITGTILSALFVWITWIIIQQASHNSKLLDLS
jgi:uncharacterized protein